MRMRLAAAAAAMVLLMFLAGMGAYASGYLENNEMASLIGGCTVCGGQKMCLLSPCTFLTPLCIPPPTAYPAFDGPKPLPQDCIKGGSACGRKFKWVARTRTCPGYSGGCGGTVALYDVDLECETQ